MASTTKNVVVFVVKSDVNKFGGKKVFYFFLPA